jgi:hypothetical protein
MSEEILIGLASDLILAKTVEDTAKQNRIAIEEKIAALIPGPERGQKTANLPDGVKITVERGFNYKADCQAIEKLDLQITGYPIKTKSTRELDVVGYEWYQQNHPGLFSQISKHVVVTPKKVSVTIKVK